jgi:hypothetical protein
MLVWVYSANPAISPITPVVKITDLGEMESLNSGFSPTTQLS